MKARSRLGFGLMLAGVAALVIFHFMEASGFAAWLLWPFLFRASVAQGPAWLLLPAVVAMPTLSVVVLAAIPACVWLGQSGVIRRLLMVLAVLSSATMAWYAFEFIAGFIPALGVLALSPALTFLGLCCFRPPAPLLASDS